MTPLFNKGSRRKTHTNYRPVRLNHTRGHKAVLVKPYCRLDQRKFSFSQSTITDWYYLSHDCVNATSVNMFKDKIDNIHISLITTGEQDSVV